MKKAATALTITSLIIAFLAFSYGSGSLPGSKTLRVATTTGPHAEILYAAREIAAKDGLTIEILEYGDNVQPNDLLLKGKVDANSFQALPYLEGIVADRRLPLTAVAKTVVFPVALYSEKVTQITDLPAGATVAIPSDPGGGGRSLLLLAKVGLITLRDGAGLQAAVTDIVANPHNIRITEIDAGDIGRRMAEFDLVAIGSVYAAANGLVPARDAIASEGADSPYPHIIAVRSSDKDNPAVRKFIAAYHSDHVKNYIREHFQGAVVTAW